MKIPVIDLTQCHDCDVCTAVCPAVFRKSEMGYMVVVELASYPEAEVDEAIKNCPGRCIFREDL